MYGTVDVAPIEQTSTIERLEAKTARILSNWSLNREVNDLGVPLSVRMEQLAQTVERIRKRAEELGW